MFYHRTRGRPEDPKNVAASEKGKALAETILVHQLNKFARPKAEEDRSRQHYEEFKKSYEGRFAQRNVKTEPLIVESSIKDRSKFRLVSEGRIGQQNFSFDLFSDTVNRAPFVEKKPLMCRTPVKTIKTIPIDVPRYGASAIYNPKCNRDTEAMLLLNKLKEMESKYQNLPSLPEEEDEVPMGDVLKTIEDTNEKISMAATQLQEIQKLIREKGKTPLSTVDEEPELSPKKSSKRTTPSKPQRDTTSTKWTPRNATLKKQQDTKKKKLVLTLTQLNQRILKMQEKYFNEPGSKYKSINDFNKKDKIKKRIETIYTNNDFDPEQEVSKIVLETSVKGNVKDTAKKYEVKNSMRKLFKIKKKSESDIKSKYEFSSDMSSDNYLFNKNVGTDNYNFDAYNDNYIGNEIHLNQDASSVNIILSPERPMFFDSPEESREGERLPNLKETSNQNLSTEESDSVFTVSGLNDSIFKSDFLMKEFDINPKDMCIDLGKVSEESSRKSKKSVRFLPDPQKFFLDKNENKSKINSAFLRDSIRQQLKHSLFDI